ncbi:MAG: hypothetical protein QXY49_02340 [Thermofilaceae archaeon]
MAGLSILGDNPQEATSKSGFTVAHCGAFNHVLALLAVKNGKRKIRLDDYREF